MRRMRREMRGRERGRSDDDEEELKGVDDGDEEETPALGRPRGAIVISCGAVPSLYFLSRRLLQNNRFKLL